MKLNYTDTLVRRLGLVPLNEQKNAYNPAAIAAAYAKADNAHVWHTDENGNRFRLGEGFGAFDRSNGLFSGYAVPDMSLLMQAFGTTQLTGQQIIGKARWSETTYTDNSTTQLSPFSTVQTGSVTGNTELAGTIPNQLHFIIRAIKINVETGASYQTTGAVATAFNDIFLLTNNAIYTLQVLRKVYLQIPLYMLPAGVGISGVLASADTTNHATWAYATHGLPDPRAVWVLTNPLLLFQQTSYQVTLAWEAAQDISGNTVISTIHDGQEIGPVQ